LTFTLNHKDIAGFTVHGRNCKTQLFFINKKHNVTTALERSVWKKKQEFDGTIELEMVI